MCGGMKVYRASVFRIVDKMHVYNISFGKCMFIMQAMGVTVGAAVAEVTKNDLTLGIVVNGGERPAPPADANSTIVG